MGGDNMAANPLDELKRLDEQVNRVRELADLKPLYFRLDEISKANTGDFEIQLAVADIKQHLVNHGMKLKEGLGTTGPFAAPPLPANPATPAFGGPPPMPPTMAPPPQPSVKPGGSGPPPAFPSPDQTALTEAMLRPLAAAPPDFAKGQSGPPPGQAPQSTPPYAAPAAPGGVPTGPPPNLTPQPAVPKGAKAPLNWKRALWIGGLAGSVLSIAAIVALVQLARNRNTAPPVPVTTDVQVEITSNPPGASIGINNEVRCTSNCKVALAPGNYQVTAMLEGFEPAASGVTVAAGAPISVNLNLEPLSQTMRLLTDLDAGKITLDDNPPADLQEGQFVLDKVTPGSHTVRLTGRNTEATFQFEVAPGKAPVLTSPIQTKNLVGVIVSSFGSRAKVVSNAGPWKLALNGQAQGDVSPGGVDLQGFAPGVQEFVIGEGKDQKTLRESFGAAPILTAFFKTDQNVGTLIVAAGEDGATVYLNERPYARKTVRGQVRVQTLGNVSVRVSKDGFQSEPAQMATIKKGEETRVEFKLKPQPQVGALQLRGASPGTQVFLDQRNLGTVGADGTFSFSGIVPGEHTIELRREQFATRRITRPFRAGDTITLAGADVTLASGAGTLRILRNPAEAAVTWRKAEDNQTHEVRGNQVDLPPGAYVFTAKSANYADRTVSVQVAASETRNLDLTQSRVTAAKQESVARPGGMADWEDSAAWSKDGDVYTRRGGGFVLYKISPVKGVVTFTVQLLKGGGVFRGGRVRWFVDYVDGKNYAQFEMDKKNFFAKDVVAGRNNERAKTPHDSEKQNEFTMQIEITPDRLVHKIRSGDQWVVLDSWNQSGRNFTDGKFGFLVQGSDEIAISNFRFAPR